MAGINDILKVARKCLGMREPNAIQRWYESRNGNLGGNWPWCDASVTYWAFKSGNHKAVCPKGDRAYTVAHAQDFKRISRWYPGTPANVRKAKPGDIVFFDWEGSDSVGAIDHVGIVEKNLGKGRLQTIEGNTSNRCMRKVRTANMIAGYGRPAYSGKPKPAPKPSKPFKWNGKAPPPTLSEGSKGDAVRQLQCALNKVLGGSNLKVDGEYSPATAKKVKAFQDALAKKKLITFKGRGVYGKITAKKLADVLAGKRPGQRPAQRLSEKGAAFIAGFEGMKRKLYNDPVGHCTIGIGHLVHRGRCNGNEPAEFKKGITREQAFALLQKDAKRMEQAVRSIGVPLNQNQFDALVSFTYNLGPNWVKGKSGLLSALKARRFGDVPRELNKWCHAGGKRLPGLVRRRQAEGRLFAKRAKSAPAPKPSEAKPAAKAPMSRPASRDAGVAMA